MRSGWDEIFICLKIIKDILCLCIGHLILFGGLLQVLYTDIPWCYGDVDGIPVLVISYTRRVNRTGLHTKRLSKKMLLLEVASVIAVFIKDTFDIILYLFVS